MEQLDEMFEKWWRQPYPRQSPGSWTEEEVKELCRMAFNDASELTRGKCVLLVMARRKKLKSEIEPQVESVPKETIFRTLGQLAVAMSEVDL